VDINKAFNIHTSFFLCGNGAIGTATLFGERLKNHGELRSNERASPI
jgi:hypothetical protein